MELIELIIGYPIYWVIIGILPTAFIVASICTWLKKDVKEIPRYQIIIVMMIVGAVIDLLGLI